MGPFKIDPGYRTAAGWEADGKAGPLAEQLVQPGEGALQLSGEVELAFYVERPGSVLGVKGNGLRLS